MDALTPIDETKLRDMFGFTKTKALVYKERGADGPTITTLPIASVELARLDSDGKTGSLDITLEDGRRKRICSSYLKEMQSPRFTFESGFVEEE